MRITNNNDYRIRDSEHIADFYTLIKIFIMATIAISLFVVDQVRAESVSNSERSEIENTRNHTLEGVIRSSGDSGEVLIGASVFISGLDRGATTDVDGQFRIDNLPEGDYTVRFSFIGYQTKRKTVTIPSEPLEVELESEFVRFDDVVVTAQPTRSAVNYQSARSYSESDLARRSSTSLAEMIDGEPGVSTRSFGSGPARPVIRGFDGERLVVLENGERMGDIQSTAPDHAVTLDPLNMNRVEVVRGPASLLYGSSALGGVVNMFTNDAPRDWSPGLTLGVTGHGATDNRLRSGAGAMTYGNENYVIAASGVYRKSDSFSNLQNTFIDSYSYSAGASMKRDRIRAGASFRYYVNDYGVPEFTREDGVEVEPDMEVLIDRLNIGAYANVDLGGFFRELDFRFSASNSLQEEGEAPNFELIIDTGTISSTAMLIHEPLGFLNEGVFGVNLHRRFQDVGGLEAYHPGEDIWNIAAFTLQEATLTDRLRMQVGARIEHEWQDTQPVAADNFDPEAMAANPDVPDTPPAPDALVFTNESFTHLNLAASAGFNFRASDSWEFGTNFARAHRNPTILELYADGWHAGASRIEIGDPSLEPEIGYGIDLFTRFRTSQLRAELTGFYNTLQNFIALENLGTQCGGQINMGDLSVPSPQSEPECVRFFSTDAEMLGFEFDLAYLLTERIRVNFGTDYVRGTQTGSNDPLPMIPPFRTNVGAMYDDGTFSLGGNLRLVSSQTRTPSDELDSDGYMLLRLQSSYQFELGGGIHQFSLRVDNALNTTYQDHMNVTRRFDVETEPGLGRRADMPGRNVNLIYRLLF